MCSAFGSEQEQGLENDAKVGSTAKMKQLIGLIFSSLPYHIVCNIPPSTNISSPVTNDARVEAKNTTACAISSGLPNLLIGIRSSILS